MTEKKIIIKKVSKNLKSMGNLIDLPGINVEDFTINSSSSSNKKNNFSLQNYLNVRLDKGEKKKTLTIRILPMNLETGNPFVLVHMHNVKVPKEVSPSGWKSYVCLKKNRDIDHEKYGERCPFCDLNSSAYEKSTQVTDQIEKEAWQKISIQNKSNEAVIVRCIERGKEDEGVKFWKFNLRKDESDPYHSIMALYNERKENGENIFDYNKGRDLKVTITEGNAAPIIIDGKQCPLSDNYEQAEAWIRDPKKWQEVFVAKPYEYLKLVSEMKYPWFDNEKKIWVDKAEYDAEHGYAKAASDEEIKRAEEALKDEPVKGDDSFMNAITLDESGSSPVDSGTDDDFPF